MEIADLTAEVERISAERDHYRAENERLRELVSNLRASAKSGGSHVAARGESRGGLFAEESRKRPCHATCIHVGLVVGSKVLDGFNLASIWRISFDAYLHLRTRSTDETLYNRD